jgi:hypothetical protein
MPQSQIGRVVPRTSVVPGLATQEKGRLALFRKRELGELFKVNSRTIDNRRRGTRLFGEKL